MAAETETLVRQAMEALQRRDPRSALALLDQAGALDPNDPQILMNRALAQRLMGALPAAVETLDRLGWLDDAQRAALAPWRASAILSARGAAVGQRRPAFHLQAVWKMGR